MQFLLNTEKSNSKAYYDSDISIWLSVDPLSDKYPSLSPYAYCAGNPIKLIDIDGRDIWVGFEATHSGHSGHATVMFTTYEEVKVNINGEMKTMYKPNGFAIAEQNQYNRINKNSGDYKNWESTVVNERSVAQALKLNQDSRIKISSPVGTLIDGVLYFNSDQITSELTLADYTQKKENDNKGKETFDLISNNCTDYAAELLGVIGIDTKGKEKILATHKSGVSKSIANPNSLYKWMKDQITNGNKSDWIIEIESKEILESPRQTIYNYGN